MGLCSNPPASCLVDTAWVDAIQIASTIAFSSRAANTIYSRSNGTLLTIENLSEAIPLTISPADIFLVLNTMFGNESLTPAQVAAQGYTIIDDFVSWVWSYVNQYVMYGSLGGAEDFFRSLITIPLIWAQANGMNYSNSSTTKIDSPLPGLPSNLYTTAILAEGESRVVIARWTVIVFTVLSSLIFLWCILLLVWAMRTQGPRMSPWPLIDFGSRIATGVITESSTAECFSSLSLARRSEIRKRLQGYRLFLRILPEGEASGQNPGKEMIGLTASKRMKALRFWNGLSDVPSVNHEERNNYETEKGASLAGGGPPGVERDLLAER